MKILICLIFGYLIGSLSPSAFISKIKNKNLKEHGTKNLGATNTMLVIGKGYGALVLLFDIAKAFFAVRLADWIFPALSIAGLLAGSAAVVGHIYPFYMKFKGGKGLAAFGGLILGVDPLLFLILLALTLVLMFIINYSAAMPMAAGILFPILYGIRTGSVMAAVISAAISLVIIIKHFENVLKAIRGEDVKIREYFKKHMLH